MTLLPAFNSAVDIKSYWAKIDSTQTMMNVADKLKSKGLLNIEMKGTSIGVSIC